LRALLVALSQGDRCGHVIIWFMGWFARWSHARLRFPHIREK